MIDKRIVFYAKESLHREFKSIAAKEGLSIKDAVNEALIDWLSKIKNKKATQNE